MTELKCELKMPKWEKWKDREQCLMGKDTCGWRFSVWHLYIAAQIRPARTPPPYILRRHKSWWGVSDNFVSLLKVIDRRTAAFSRTSKTHLHENSSIAPIIPGGEKKLCLFPQRQSLSVTASLFWYLPWPWQNGCPPWRMICIVLVPCLPSWKSITNWSVEL